ncbi:hypothetical protein LTR66_004278 [Elasticomyces elasticus]|nr:hypothetical protein LTR66_004278 [Elasticomyces elasticus]
MSWLASFDTIDEESAALIMQIQLEDSKQLGSRFKGKQKEGEVSDIELALQLYREELDLFEPFRADRQMARSMATAIMTDGPMLSEAASQEQQVGQDRILARRFQTDGCIPALSSSVGSLDDDSLDDETLAKLAAKYVSDASTPDAVSHRHPKVGADHTIPESSRWAATRTTEAPTGFRRCVACTEDKKFYDLARAPCQHEYCRNCLASLFESAMTDESLYPPRCCRQVIPVNRVRVFLSSELTRRFEKKSIELDSKDRTYCFAPSCSTFISNDNIKGDIATCLECSRTTCVTCKAAAHTGDCPNDAALQQLLATAENQEWQRCYSCHRMVELNTGCNHIRWKTCQCPQWHEDRLYARATAIVDRGPERRMFRPPVDVMNPEFELEPVPPAPEIPSTLSGDGQPERVPRVGQLDETTATTHIAVPEEADLLPARDELALSLPVLALRPARAGSMNAAEIVARDLRIAHAIANLRENHECAHERWRFIRGPHVCEVCHNHLRQYIFECRQCNLYACNRCRRNRL